LKTIEWKIFRAAVALLVKQLKKDNPDSEDAFHNLIEIDGIMRDSQ
jgi:hypothetical protein